MSEIDFKYASELLLRLTHDHPSPDAQLDEWLKLGKVRVIIEYRAEPTHDQMRNNVSHYNCMWGVVRIDNDKALRQRWRDNGAGTTFADWRERQIEQALRDTFGKSECKHGVVPPTDWGCGCRSETAAEVYREYHDLWRIMVKTWFNR